MRVFEQSKLGEGRRKDFYRQNRPISFIFYYSGISPISKTGPILISDVIFLFVCDSGRIVGCFREASCVDCVDIFHCVKGNIYNICKIGY